MLQSGRNCKIAAFLTTFTVSRRTIYRDFKDLRHSGIPFVYDKTDHCYKLGPGFNFVIPNLSMEEALGLLLVVCKAQRYINIPFGDAALKAAHKIEGVLPAEVRRYCNTRLQHISVKEHPQTTTELLGKTFSQLLEAITRQRVLDIHYYLPVKKKKAVTTLHPYHLLYDGYNWCVLGWSGLHKRVCALKLNRIKEINLSGKCFIEEKRFDINDYLGRAWSVRREGTLYNIKLWFAPDIAFSVANIQWHRTQTVDFKDDGSVIIEFRVDGLNEITWWILSYGEKVRVLAPEVLGKKIAETAKNMLRAHRGKGPGWGIQAVALPSLGTSSAGGWGTRAEGGNQQTEVGKQKYEIRSTKFSGGHLTVETKPNVQNTKSSTGCHPARPNHGYPPARAQVNTQKNNRK